MALIMHDAFSPYGLAAGCALLFLVVPVAQVAEQLPDTPSIDIRAWILMDYASGKVLSEGNVDEKLDPASLTRIMTSHVVGQVVKAGKIKLTDMMTIGRDVWTTDSPALRGSLMTFLKPGMQVSVEDLDKGVIIQSSNDASTAIADYAAGSQGALVSLMNGYVKKMGLTSTTFATVYGLDAPGQFSTARDMALLTKAMIHNVSEECAVREGKEFTFNKVRQLDHDHLLWNTNLSADGVKIGTITRTDCDLVSSATQGDVHPTVVVLGTKTNRIRSNGSEKLSTWGFRFYETVTPIKLDATLITQRAWLGDSSETKLGVGEAGSAILPRGQPRNLKISYTLDQPQLIAPLGKGQAIGTIDSKLNDKTTEQRPLIAIEPVKEGDFFSRMIDFVLMKLHGWSGSWFF